MKDLQTLKSNWKDCKSSKVLMGMGKFSRVYDDEKNTHSPLDPTLADDSASERNLKKGLSELTATNIVPGTLKLYFGDHGIKEGTSTTEGHLTPESLRESLRDTKAKGYTIFGVIDHCYSGNMLSAFYDLDKFETFGCGLSAANDNVAYNYAEMLVPGNISEKARKSQRLSDSGAYLNFMMTSSDKFLAEYAQKSTPNLELKDCSMDSLSLHLGSTGEPVFQAMKTVIESQVHAELVRDIADIEEDFRLVKAQTLKMEKSYAKHPNGSDYLMERTDELELSLREAVINKLIKNPKYQSLFQKETELRSTIEACVEKLGRPAEECPKYEAFSEVNAHLKSAINAGKRLVTIGEIDHKVRNKKQLAKKYIEKLHEQYFVTRQHELMKEKRSFLAVKKLGLLKLLKNNDANAIKAYQELRKCEKTGSI